MKIDYKSIKANNPVSSLGSESLLQLLPGVVIFVRGGFYQIITEEPNSFIGFPPKIKIEDNSIGENEKEGEEREKTITNQYGATTFVNYN